MNLTVVESIVLRIIKYDSYPILSVSTEPDKVTDFSLLHYCVFMARGLIKFNTTIRGLLKTNIITTTAGTQTYSLATDFDIPVKAIYKTSSAEYELEQVNSSNLLYKLNGSNTTDSGTPTLYEIFGNSSNVLQMKLYLTPDTANQIATIRYKPILALLSSPTDEDIIMQKYPETVVNLTSAYAFQMIKNDNTNFDKFYMLGTSDFAKIDKQEQSADSYTKILPDSLIRTKRGQRYSK